MSSPTRITLWTRRRGEAVYLNLINKAERYVYAMTPYLIISDSVNTALCNAAKSGWTCASSPRISRTRHWFLS